MNRGMKVLYRGRGYVKQYDDSENGINEFAIVATKNKEHRGCFVTGTDFADDLQGFGMATISELGFIYKELPRGIIPRFAENSVFIITDENGNPDSFTLTKDKTQDIHENGNALKLIFDDAPPAQNNNNEKPLSETERQTMLKLIYGMAIDGYSFNPREKNSQFTGQTSEGLAAQLQGVGIDVSYKSVKKYIDMAKELLEPEREKQCTQKN